MFWSISWMAKFSRLWDMVEWHLLWFSIAGDWKCRDGGFKCTTGDITCINSALLCDDFNHCIDASDESCGRCFIIKNITVLIRFCDYKIVWLIAFGDFLPTLNCNVNIAVTVKFCDFLPALKPAGLWIANVTDLPSFC